MLNKSDVLTLRDLALEQLPKVRATRDAAAQHSRRTALQAVAFSPLGTQYNPASTAIELQASRLLALVGKHPETHDEHLIDVIDDDSLSITIEQALAEAERDRQKTETQLLEAARELCRLSGANSPAWMWADITPNGGALVASEAVPTPSLAAPFRHQIRDRAPSILSAEIAEAKRLAPDPTSVASVWDELTKLAGLKYGVLVGVVPEGIQYRGKVFLDTDVEYDIFTRRSLGERMRRSR